MMVKDTIISREHFIEKLGEEIFRMIWHPESLEDCGLPIWEEMHEESKAVYYSAASRALSRSASYLNEETPDGY